MTLLISSQISQNDLINILMGFNAVSNKESSNNFFIAHSASVADSKSGLTIGYLQTDFSSLVKAYQNGDSDVITLVNDLSTNFYNYLKISNPALSSDVTINAIKDSILNNTRIIETNGNGKTILDKNGNPVTVSEEYKLKENGDMHGLYDLSSKAGSLYNSMVSYLKTSQGQTDINKADAYTFQMKLQKTLSDIDSINNNYPDLAGGLQYGKIDLKTVAFLETWENQSPRFAKEMISFLVSKKISITYNNLLQNKDTIVNNYVTKYNLSNASVWKNNYFNNAVKYSNSINLNSQKYYSKIQSVLQEDNKPTSITSSILSSISNFLFTQAHAASIGYVLDNPKISEFLNLITIGKVRPDPMVIDIYKDGINISSNDDSSHYITYNNSQLRTSWVGTGTDFLVTLDSNGNPQLIGNNTQSGYQQLAQYDTNGDGIIDSSDLGYSKLYLWNGKDINNIQKGDIISLTDFGIKSISLIQSDQNTDINGSTLVSTSTVTYNDGVTTEAGEVNLNASPTYTITEKDQELSSGTLSTTLTNTDGSTINLSTLPNWHGYGVLSSLTASMITITADNTESLNNTLYQDVLGLTQLDLSTTSYTVLLQSFDTLLKDWSDTGTVYEGDSNTVLPDTEMFGNYRLQVLDKYLGQATYFEGHSTYISYGWPPKAYLDVAYTDLEENLVGEFFLQSQYKDLGTYISYDETNDILSFNTDASGNSYTYANLLTYANANYATAMADPTSSFYNILSDLIYGTMTSEDDNISDVFTSLATVSPEQASEILMTSEGLQIYQYNNIENINSSLIGETTYIWSGVVNEDIHQAVDTSSNYFAWDQQMLSPTDSTLLIDSTSSAISVGLTSGNTTEPNGYISFSINGYVLNVGDTAFQQLTAIDFNDNDISIENNEFVIGSNAIVLGDTSTLANNMYVLNNAIVTYNFSQNINLNSTGNYSINIDSTATFTASSFSFNGTSYTTTLNGYTLTINEIKDVEIKIEQNNKNIAYLYNGTINTSNPSKGVSSLTETISTPGSYIYNASTYTDNFDITNTTGTDTIEMAGHSGSLSENLKYTASSTGDTEMYQTSATDIQIISGDLTINLKNAFVENPNSPTYFYSDLANINNKSLINSSFNIQQSGTIAITGYAGTFTDTLLDTVTDLEIRTGTNNNITDADGHSLFIESLNGAITTGQTNMNIYVSLNPSINIGIQAQNILASATYSDGNIVWTNSYTGNTYTLMNASDFVKANFNISFDTTQSRFGMSLGNVNLIYNISNEDLPSESSGTLLTNLLTMQNTINLTDTDNSLITIANSKDNYLLKVERNIYNINGAGTYKIISDDYYDDININVASNIEVQENNGYIAFDYSLAKATYNMDDDGNLLISQNGYTVQIDDYKDYYGTIKTVINGYNTPLSSSGNISITSSSDYQAVAYQKSNWIYTYDSDLTFSYNDEYSTSSINNQTTNSTETFNLNNSANFYSNGAGDNITVNLLQNNYFSLSGSGTYSNIALSGSDLSFTYTINSKTSNFTLTNAIDYFSNQQDVIKDTNSAFSSIDTTLVRNIMSVSTDTILSTDFNKIFATQSNITLTDNAGNNEFAINQSATDITLSSTVSGDTIILDGDYSKNTLFSVSNNILDIHNLNSSQNIYVDMSKDTNITLAFNDGKTISATNALTFSQDVSKMTVGAGSVVENILSTTDYKAVMALYNQN